MRVTSIEVTREKAKEGERKQRMTSTTQGKKDDRLRPKTMKTNALREKN